MKRVDKRAIVSALRAEVAREMATLSRAAKDAREAATHEESKPENDKDTRGLEAAYLAGAQATRVRELESVDNALEFATLRTFTEGDVISQTALVTLELDGAKAPQHFFVAPVCGGTRVTIEGVEVQVVTPQSPLGQALLGRAVGDVVELRTKHGVRAYEVMEVM